MSQILQDLSVAALLNANEANIYAGSPFSYNLPQTEVYQGQDISWCISDVPLLPCNIVFKARLQPGQIDATIASVIETARRKNVPLRWWVGKDTEPADLGDLLMSRGFTTNGATQLMAIDLLSMKNDIPMPSGVSITEVKDKSAFETWCHIAAKGFGIPPQREPAMSRWFTIALNLKLQMHLYLAFQNGEPVATSQLFLAEGVAGIYYVATIPDAQHQGIASGVTLKALQAALPMGYRVGILQSSKLGENLYRKMGFEVSGTMTAYQWRNSPSGA